MANPPEDDDIKTRDGPREPDAASEHNRAVASDPNPAKPPARRRRATSTKRAGDKTDGEQKAAPKPRAPRKTGVKTGAKTGATKPQSRTRKTPDAKQGQGEGDSAAPDTPEKPARRRRAATTKRTTTTRRSTATRRETAARAAKGTASPSAEAVTVAAQAMRLTDEDAKAAGLWTDAPSSPSVLPPDHPSALVREPGLQPAEQSADKPAAPSPWRPRWSWVDAWARWLTPLFTGLARFRAVAALCVALVAIAAFVPGFTTIPPIDRDESRFSQASRQMVATGDYIDIRFQAGSRYQKPVGIYWLQAAAVHLYGAEDGQAPIWVYRTVSFAGAVLAALLVYWLALGFGPPTVAFAAGLLVALTILLGAEARLAKTDAMLFAAIVIAQGVLARAFLSRRDSGVRLWHAALFWTACAAGILIKGPILPMVVGTTAVAACLIERRVQWLRRLRPGIGIIWMLLLALPWFIAIGITSGGEFFAESIGRDLFEKIGESRERPFVPPGVFVFGFFPTLGWPLAPLAFLAIPFAIATWRDKGTRFLVAWIVPTWLIFELSATKLPHYILPIYPALAILAARMLVFDKIPKGWLAGIAKGLFLLIPLVATFGIPVILLVYGDSINPAGAALALLGLIVLIAAFFLLVRRHGRASLVLTVIGTLVLYAGSFGFHIPAARTIWVTPQLVATLDAVRCEDAELATLGYNEPSLVLMTRTDLRMLAGPDAAAQFLAGEGCRAAFVDAPFVPAMLEQLAALSEGGDGAATRLVARVEGININGGDALDLHVFAAGEP